MNRPGSVTGKHTAAAACSKHDGQGKQKQQLQPALTGLTTPRKSKGQKPKSKDIKKQETTVDKRARLNHRKVQNANRNAHSPNQTDRRIGHNIAEINAISRRLINCDLVQRTLLQVVDGFEELTDSMSSACATDPPRHKAGTNRSTNKRKNLRSQVVDRIRC